MKRIIIFIKLFVFSALLFSLGACHDLLDEPAENRIFTESTDYTAFDDMILPIIGSYAEFYSRGWEEHLLIGVRGDDVNAAGDQSDFVETDKFNYNKDFWMFNSVWQNQYRDIFVFQSAMDEIELYKEAGASASLADQYIAEAKVLRAFLMFQLSRLWGDIYIPQSADPNDFLQADVTPKAEVMQFISDQMDEVIPLLPDGHPKDRTDIPGGVTKYTAMAIKALANLELENYQGVADATSQIISSGVFKLEPDFYELFKLKGKLNDENIFEMQFSDYGQPSGDRNVHLFAPYGPQNWGPLKPGASGWGFYEPSIKFITFMLDRNERVRLPTSVLFTPDGINDVKQVPGYSTLPDWVSNITASGDTIKNSERAQFSSGKHYLPTNQLTPGRTSYGGDKNFTLIRYAEILLMHAEALTQGATSSAMTADAAVNLVRSRAGLTPLTGVTNAQVMDEKFAELAMEWGIRYYDLVRLQNYDELNYGGRTFKADLVYLPYPQNQVDQLPGLRKQNQEQQ